MNKVSKYKELKNIISCGLFKKAIKCKPFCDPDAKKKVYVEFPGQDIYFMLPYLTDEQMQEIAELVSIQFPIVPPDSNINFAACIRFIYGQSVKTGLLRSNKIGDERIDWTLSRKFLKLLYNIFENKNNYYGLTILCEMEAHRLGDEAIFYHDENKLKEMEEMYLKSVKYAYKCKSNKQMFTPYYWAFKYFEKFGNNKKALEYSKLTLEGASNSNLGNNEIHRKKKKECIQYIEKQND